MSSSSSDLEAPSSSETLWPLDPSVHLHWPEISAGDTVWVCLKLTSDSAAVPMPKQCPVPSSRAVLQSRLLGSPSLVQWHLLRTSWLVFKAHSYTQLNFVVGHWEMEGIPVISFLWPASWTLPPLWIAYKVFSMHILSNGRYESVIHSVRKFTTVVKC